MFSNIVPLMTITASTYQKLKIATLQGRYVTFRDIDNFLQKIGKPGCIKLVGQSVLGTPLKSFSLGTGSKKVLMWSQMHGNESTTTKAVLDVINFLHTPSNMAEMILESCTLLILPMLNPDGAAEYTRVNANGVDLNRDAQEQSQPESKVLRKVFDRFSPDYCFNLHDQRTIFNVGSTPKPATVSFLAPAHDEERSVSASRAESMRLIVAMNADLQKRIPDQVGRYDDAFNPNCVGDTFQMTGTPTILFEAGHFPNDYNRESTREYIFYALTAALKTISENNVHTFDESLYTTIPENNKLFLDVLIHNAKGIVSSLKDGEGLGILYKEKLEDGAICFEPNIEITGDLKAYFGHKTYNALVDNDLMTLKNDVLLAPFLGLF